MVWRGRESGELGVGGKREKREGGREGGKGGRGGREGEREEKGREACSCKHYNEQSRMRGGGGDRPTEQEVVIKQVHLRVVKSHHLVEPFRKDTLQYTSKMGCVVQEELEPIAMTTSEPLEHSPGIGVASRSSKVVKKHLAAEGWRLVQGAGERGDLRADK